MPADLTYPRRLMMAPGEVRDLFEDFQGYAEVTPIGSTSQSGEAGEGQTISSGTCVPSSVSITAGTVTVSGTRLTAQVTIPSNLAVGEYSLRWAATTSGNKVLSRKVTLDVKDI